RRPAPDGPQLRAIRTRQVALRRLTTKKGKNLFELEVTFAKELALAHIRQSECPRFAPMGRVVVLRELRKFLKHVDHRSTGKIHHQRASGSGIAADRAQR